jgi:hypothetical protein
MLGHLGTRHRGLRDHLSPDRVRVTGIEARTCERKSRNGRTEPNDVGNGNQLGRGSRRIGARCKRGSRGWCSECNDDPVRSPRQTCEADHVERCGVPTGREWRLTQATIGYHTYRLWRRRRSCGSGLYTFVVGSDDVDRKTVETGCQPNGRGTPHEEAGEWMRVHSAVQTHRQPSVSGTGVDGDLLVSRIGQIHRRFDRMPCNDPTSTQSDIHFDRRPMRCAGRGRGQRTAQGEKHHTQRDSTLEASLHIRNYRADQARKAFLAPTALRPLRVSPVLAAGQVGDRAPLRAGDEPAGT